MARPEVMQQDDEGGVDNGGYDSWSCREQSGLIGAGLQCVSCGVQQYYSDQGLSDIVPSEKWIMLLAVNDRIHRDLNGSRKRDNIRGTVESNNLKRLVISKIQAYGFCTKYISQRTMKLTGGRNYRDLSSEDWQYIKDFMGGARLNPNDSRDQNGIAKELFGFRDTLVGQGSAAAMSQFLDDTEEDNEGMSVMSKRSAFKNKLGKALGNGYDVSGERIDTPNTIAAGDKDQGLRQCLQEVQQRLNSPEFADGNFGFCSAMAKSCSLQDDFCGQQNAPPIPRPANNSSYGRGSGGGLPPPPAPGSRGNGAVQ